MAEANLRPPEPSWLSKAAVEEFASRVAAALGVSPGDPLEPVIERLGGKIIYGWNDADEIHGGSIEAWSLRDFTIRISELTSPTRDRFTIAHELGHLFLHLQQVKKVDSSAGMRATRYVDLTNEKLQRAEWEANWFAAELLMPKSTFPASVEKFGLSYAASLFGVSRSAADIRVRSLEAR